MEAWIDCKNEEQSFLGLSLRRRPLFESVPVWTQDDKCFIRAVHYLDPQCFSLICISPVFTTAREFPKPLASSSAKTHHQERVCLDPL